MALAKTTKLFCESSTPYLPKKIIIISMADFESLIERFYVI
jgi:hypothetical protein